MLARRENRLNAPATAGGDGASPQHSARTRA